MKYKINYKLTPLSEPPTEPGWYCICQDERPRDVIFFDGENWSVKNLEGIKPKNWKIIHWLKAMPDTVLLNKTEVEVIKKNPRSGFGNWI